MARSAAFIEPLALRLNLLIFQALRNLAYGTGAVPFLYPP
jgi:hypothetical protein